MAVHSIDNGAIGKCNMRNTWRGNGDGLKTYGVPLSPKQSGGNT